MFLSPSILTIMPLAPKHNHNNPFNCPGCTQIFQTRSGLSQHYRKKHRLASSPLIDFGDNQAIPLFPEAVGVPPDIAQIVSSRPQVIATSLSPESETGGESSIISSPSPGRGTQDDFYTDSDADTEDSDLDTQIHIHVGLSKLPEMFKFGDILPHPNAGYIYDIPGQESRTLKIQEQDHRRLGHPYHPWSSENELWLSNFIFFKAKMTIGTADVMMSGIKDGRLSIDGLAITRARKMLSIIDDGAKYMPVSSVIFCFVNWMSQVNLFLISLSYSNFFAGLFHSPETMKRGPRSTNFGSGTL